MAYQNDNERRQFFEDRNIADDHQQEEVFKGIQPKNQLAFRIFKLLRIMGIFFLFFALLAYGLTFVAIFKTVAAMPIYTKVIMYLGAASLGMFVLMFLVKLIFLRKAPFDDWVFEIAEKRLGTSVIFYDAKRIYIQYDRSGKEVDKKEFVTEMSDKSIHYSYFYTKTDIDQGYIVVECKQRAPIPNKASFSPNDDKFWNIVPMGLTINPNTQKVSPIGWYLNDQNINEELYTTVPSTSILICGGTGCYNYDTPILMHNTLVQ